MSSSEDALKDAEKFAKIRSLEMYYAQKDGCKKHPAGAGKICVECVSDELAIERSKAISLAAELATLEDAGTEALRELSARKARIAELEKALLSLGAAGKNMLILAGDHISPSVRDAWLKAFKESGAALSKGEGR